MKARRILLCVPMLISVIFLAAPGAAHAQMFWNQAATFAGTTSSYVAVPHSPSLDITSSFSIEAWVKPTDINNPPVPIIVGKGASPRYDFRLSSTGFPGRVAVRTNGTSRLYSRSAIQSGVWTHLATTYNSSTGLFTIYINGALDTSATVAGAAPTSVTDSLIIGNGFNNPFGGELDDIRIWNRDLTGAEISRNYRTSLGATGGVYAGLVFSMTFQREYGSAGTTFSLSDWSGNGNTGFNRNVTAHDLSNRPQTYTSFNEAVLFDGTDDYLAGVDNTFVSPTSAVTLEAWVYPNTAGTGVIINKGLSATTPSYRLLLSGTNSLLAAVINGTLLSSTANIAAGQWTHVACTYNSSTGGYSFYKDGTQTNSGTNSLGAINDGTDSLLIGGGLGLIDFNGYIDEVRIANYAKTAADIRAFVYQSIDNSNEPNSGSTNVVYNLDGVAVDNCADGGPRMFFNGTAMFSSPSRITNVPVSPLNRADAQNLTAGFHMKTSNRRIPQTGTSGLMITDSLGIGQSLTMTDVNFFLATNHTFDSDMDITLFAPNGDSVNVCFDYLQLGDNDNIITLFDDNADSSLVNSRYTSCAPWIKPQNSMNAVFAGDNAQGVWRLKINDDAGGDTGRVYAWGIQINNQTIVGVEEGVAELPGTYELAQNYPNPFNPSTTIQFSIPTAGVVRLVLYDILGRQVATLLDEEKAPGTYKVDFNGSQFASGTYFYRLQSGTFSDTKKLLLLK